MPITDPKMTRFWISIEKGVDFVIKVFQMMKGGEIFVPKIPSIRITDLASVVAPGLGHEIVGLRPGEKIHEVMCPKENSHLTIEFDDHFLIEPAIQFFDRDGDFSVNQLGEAGQHVEPGFEYNSGTNPEFLSPSQIRRQLTENL